MDEIIDKEAVVKQAINQIKKGDGELFVAPINGYTKATALTLLALYHQNEEIIAQNKTMIQNSADNLLLMEKIVR